MEGRYGQPRIPVNRVTMKRLVAIVGVSSGCLSNGGEATLLVSSSPLSGCHLTVVYNLLLIG